MSNLIDDLTKSAPANLPYIEPRYSPKTKCISLTIYLKEVPLQVLLPIKYLDKAIDEAGAGSVTMDPLQRLIDELFHARQKFGHIIDGRKKPRGTQANRQMILLELKYSSVWAYEFVCLQRTKPPQDQYLPLQRAAERFKIEAGRTCHDAIQMA